MKNKFIKWPIIITVSIFSLVGCDDICTPIGEPAVEKYHTGQLVVMKVDKKICQIVKVWGTTNSRYNVRCPSNNGSYSLVYINEYEIERGCE